MKEIGWRKLNDCVMKLQSCGCLQYSSVSSAAAIFTYTKIKENKNDSHNERCSRFAVSVDAQLKRKNTTIWLIDFNTN